MYHTDKICGIKENIIVDPIISITFKSSSQICPDSIAIKGKYKTVGELKKQSRASIISVLSRMIPGPARDYLDKYLFDTHYSQITLCANLTNRTEKLENNVCYREIMKRCFNNVDIKECNIKTDITTFSLETKALITELHAIDPSMFGTFIDYLLRRIISELQGTQFSDNRSECMSRLKTELTHTCDERTKCKYKSNLCELPICQKLCYYKAKNTSAYKTCDIITDVFLTSLFHIEAFNGSPAQIEFNILFHKLQSSNINELLIIPLTILCQNIIKGDADILLNPSFGTELNGIIGVIQADADLVIDDILYDIKCTSYSKKTNHAVSEILQLLGYSCLMQLNKLYLKKINTVSIINILQGTITTYDISFITVDNCIKYIKILTNDYE